MSRCAVLLLLTAVAATAELEPSLDVTPSGKEVEIAPGVMMPSVSLGTCCGSDPKVGIPTWFKAGGVGIDTAEDYRDQPEIAKLITKTPRSAYFLTTKIPVHGANVPKVLTAAYALRAVEEDVKELGVKHLDLVLIHHPSKEQSYNQALWKGLEQAVAKNLTRTIGLSNFNQADIEAILKIATIRPVVNQCDLSVGGEDTQCGPRDAAIAYNQAQNITYEAWSPMKKCPFTDPKLMAIAKSHNKTTAQVCLRWILDRGCTIAVGTGSDPAKVAEYTEENLNLFDFSLTAEELETINAMSGKTY